MPEYPALCYQGVLVRLEAISRSNTTSLINGQRQSALIWYVDNVDIPNSLWNIKQEVLVLMEEAFMSHTWGAPSSRIKHVFVDLRCEPTCVEVDYNGK